MTYVRDDAPREVWTAGIPRPLAASSILGTNPHGENVVEIDNHDWEKSQALRWGDFGALPAWTSLHGT